MDIIKGRMRNIKSLLIRKGKRLCVLVRAVLRKALLFFTILCLVVKI
jgi:hypothetical protein